ncbi:MAG: hypothetical protein H7836_12490, partial [Magnetococcus sp. YQC-3]
NTSISIYVENNKLYRHDKRGIIELDIDLKLKEWNYINVDFIGSRFSSQFMYIGDFINNINGYISNFQIFRNI